MVFFLRRVEIVGTFWNEVTTNELINVGTVSMKTNAAKT